MVARIMVFKPAVDKKDNDIYLNEINIIMCGIKAFLYINKIPYVYEPPKPGDVHHITVIKILHEDFDNIDYPACQYVIEYIKNDLIENLALNIQDT